MGMREYETIFILKPDGADETLERLSGKFDRVFEDFKAVILEKENWGKKKMAYDIAKNSKGMYIYYHYLGGGALVAEVERNLKIDEAVLRYMTVKVDEDVDAESRIKAISERPKVAPSTLEDDDDGPRRDRRDRGDRDRDRGDFDRDMGGRDDRDDD